MNPFLFVEAVLGHFDSRLTAGFVMHSLAVPCSTWDSTAAEAGVFEPVSDPSL
jgi:hypothetical protein